MKASLKLFACVAVLCTSAVPAFAETPPPTYLVNLSPPVKVGAKYHIVSKAHETRDETMWRARSKSPTKTDITVDLDGIVTVKKIDSHGAGTWLEVNVTQLHVTEEGTDEEIVPPGTIISTQAAPVGDRYQRYITRQGGKLDRRQAELIEKVISAAMPEAPTPQDIFGSATPQMEGGGWALNRQRGVKYLSVLSVVVEPKDFTGKAQFVGIEKLGDTPCYHVDGSMKASTFKSSADGNVKTDKASLWVKFSSIVPRDSSLHSKYSEQGHLELAEKGVDAMVQGFRRELTMDYSQEITIEPAK